LLGLAPRIAVLRCEELEVALAPSDEPAQPPVSLALPMPVHIAEASLARVVIAREEGPLVLTEVAFGYEADAAGHRLRALSLKAGGVSLKGRGTVKAARPFPLEAALFAHSARTPAATANILLSGNLEALRVAAKTESAGAHATLEAKVAPFTGRPLERLRAELSDIDLRAFDERLPRTSLEGEIALSGARHALTGTVAISNALSGSYDRDRLPVKSIHSSVVVDTATLQLSALTADLGNGGTLEGAGTLALTRMTLDLRARALNLAALQTRLRRTRLTGRIEVDATMETQSVRAALAEGQLHLALQARRSENLVELRDVRVRARGGEARGHGRVSLDGGHSFAVEGVFRRFDPAAWGVFPRGAINGRFSARGSLSNRRVEASATLEPSRLRGEPLKGGGTATINGERITAALALEFGGNRLEVKGAFGSRAEALSLRFDAPRLALIDPRLKGAVSGIATLTGSWAAPDAKFELAGKGLAWAQRWQAASITARGVYSARADGPLQLSATASGLVAPEWRIARAGLEASGTQLKHTAALTAQGTAVDLTARAAGAWQRGRGWAGTVLEITNRGNVPIALEAPVAVEAGPDRLRVGAVAARVIGGRLDVRGLRYEGGRITSAGRFDAIPARTVLALSGLPADSGSTLRLSGAWSLVSTPRWNGTISVRSDGGDLALGAGNTLPLGLKVLTMDARVIDDRLELKGDLQSQLASAQLSGSVLPAPAPGGARIGAASPLRMSARIEVARLAAFSGLTGASLRVDGRGRTELTARGTVSQPLVTGVIEASNLSVAFPPDGVDLRDGTLRAELSEREIRVQAFSIRGGAGTLKASGVLAHGSARRSTVDWQAERLTLMNRPDRRLVVTGRGTAALADTKLALAGEVRADSGLIELRQSALPAPGDDVVIVGRTRETRETPTLRRAALDVALDFGENFRISGRGLDSFIAGRIRVQTSPAGDLLATGEVRAVRGSYQAFGQRLELEAGRLIFNGPIENPALDILAMRRKQAVEAGVQVSGTVRSPFVRVISDPPLPENEALSWLVLGQGPRDASGGDLTLLSLAAAALLNQGKSPGGGFAQRLGLDSVGMRSDTVAGRFVTVGKRLSDDIYVVFEQGVGTAAHILKLEYNLSRRWLLRAETGTASAVGVFFRWAFD
jgi:translocation and assembly module TamB